MTDTSNTASGEPVPSGASDEALTDMLLAAPTAHNAVAPRSTSAERKHASRGTAGGRRATFRSALRVLRVRFVFYTTQAESADVDVYHDALVTAESLLDRVLRAHVIGVRAIQPELGYAHERRLLVRPRRGSFSGLSAEYLRWFEVDGRSREVPLTIEELTPVLTCHFGVGTAEATHMAIAESGALPAADQAWLLNRAQLLPSHRPLHGPDLAILCRAIESAESAPIAGAVAVSNADIARRAAAILGAMTDVFMPSPFRPGPLSQAFAAFHADHLSRVSGAGGLANRARPEGTFVDVARWFAAKRDRMLALGHLWREIEGRGDQIPQVRPAIDLAPATPAGRSVRTEDPSNER